MTGHDFLIKISGQVLFLGIVCFSAFPSILYLSINSLLLKLASLDGLQQKYHNWTNIHFPDEVI